MQMLNGNVCEYKWFSWQMEGLPLGRNPFLFRFCICWCFTDWRCCCRHIHEDFTEIQLFIYLPQWNSSQGQEDGGTGGVTGEWSQSQKSWGEGESSPWTVLHSMHTDGTGDGGVRPTQIHRPRSAPTPPRHRPYMKRQTSPVNRGTNDSFVTRLCATTNDVFEFYTNVPGCRTCWRFGPCPFKSPICFTGPHTVIKIDSHSYSHLPSI